MIHQWLYMGTALILATAQVLISGLDDDRVAQDDSKHYDKKTEDGILIY